MKRVYFTFLLLIIGLIASAQNISVADFYLNETDLTARLKGTSVEDQNGYQCALIKVETTEKGLWSFDVGMLGVTKTEFQNYEHPAEIWVYVPFGVTWISIQHDRLGKLDHYKFPCSIDKGRTYIMKLTTGRVVYHVEEAVNQQYLMFQITPADALLEVNDQIWEVGSDGSAMKFVNFGSYNYRVQAPNSHTAVGKVEVNDPNDTQIVPVSLKPNFGWIEVKGEGNLNGASVFIDNALVGKAPCKSKALKSGEHNVRIAKGLYDTWSETVVVNDNETVTLSPVLNGNFAEVTLNVDADAEIWVNNEKKATRTWTGVLGSGIYKIECKQANHETSLTTKEITPSMNGENIDLTAPTPIYGSLNVESTPTLATVYVDGKEMGKTPKSIPQILIGQHEIKLAKDGYADQIEMATITQGVRAEVKVTLNQLMETDDILEKVTMNSQTSSQETELKQPDAKNKQKRSISFGVNGGIGAYNNATCGYLEWSDMYNADNVKYHNGLLYSIGINVVFPIISFFDFGLYYDFGLALETMQHRGGMQTHWELGKEKALIAGIGCANDDWYGGWGADFRIGFKFGKMYLLGEYYYTKKGSLDYTNAYLLQVGYRFNLPKHKK